MLLSVTEARQKLLADFRAVQIIDIDIEHATGYVLADDVKATYDYPLFNNSSMDGFAVRAEDLQYASRENPAQLKIVEDIPAGAVPVKEIHPGEAARIMTGAVLPEGADSVIPVEDSNVNWRENQNVEMPPDVLLYRPVMPGEYIRKIGDDIRRGQIVMTRRRLRAQDIGFLAMLGIDRVKVFRRPRIAIFSSGDELTPVGTVLAPGKIYDSNSKTLLALSEKYFAEVISLGIVPDQIAEVKKTFESAVAQNVDLVITSAGVSVGAFDYIQKVVKENGEIKFWRVNMRPGKPLAFGRYQGVPFIGLPGNPVSAFVGFEVFVRPAILKLSGDANLEHSTFDVILAEAIESDGRESYLRAVVTFEDGQYSAKLTGHQGSGNLFSLVQANALLIIPSGVKSLPEGARVSAWLLD
jgi:molybdopterin molybdotransferase